MAHLRIELFGKPEITHGNRAVSFRTRKALGLLIYLVVEGGVHTRAKLATLFWPESEAKAGRATLRSTLRYLRNAVAHASDDEGRSHLHVTRDAISFNFDSDYELDLELVEMALGDGPSADAALLQKAIGVHRGYFLEGFTLPDAAGFDDWAAFQGERWHLGLSEVFDRLSQIQAQAGETSEALETTRRWAAFDPLKEAAYRRLMRLQLVDGERTAALQTYEKCRQILAEELDVEPAPETRALAERIENFRTGDDETPAQKGRSPTGSVDVESPPTTQANVPFPFVGRNHEHTGLAETYYRCQSDGAQVIAIVGEAGVGKTRLAQEFLGWARASGATILQGRAFETGGRLPYQPVVEALRPLVPRVPDALAPTWLAELARILPELNDLRPDLPSPTADETLGRSRLFEAVARLAIEMATRAPFVLFVDDLQWADKATLDLLSYAARRWAEHGGPILLLGSVRAEALHRAVATEALREWLRGLERGPGLTRLELDALTEEDVFLFVKRFFDHEEQDTHIERFCQWLYRETQGQPFFLTETIKSLIEDGILVSRPDASAGRRIQFSPHVADSLSWNRADPLRQYVPPGVRDVVRDRLARLTPAAFDLLVAGAVLGQAFDFQGLCRVAELPRGEALAVLDSLVGNRLLAESNREKGSYTFSHDKIRDVVYTEAGDARRQLFHERALEHLRDTHAPAAQLAHHALYADHHRAAFRHSLRAGDDAMELFAVDDAIFHFEQAHRALVENPHIGDELQTSQRRHMYERLGRGNELVNDWDAAERIYEEMLADARATASPEMEVAALNRLAGVSLLGKLEFKAALSTLEIAREVAEASNDRRGLAEVECNACLTRFYIFERSTALQHGERAIALAREIGDRELTARCLNAAGYAASGVNQWTRVKEYAQEARALYADIGNVALEVDSLLLVAFASTNVGEAHASVEFARKALDASREIENEWGQANALNHLSAALLDVGLYGAALKTVQKVFSFPVLQDAPQHMAAFTVRGMVYRALQDFEAALADHLDAEEQFRRIGNPGMARVLSAHLCADYAALGRWEKAHEQAQMAMQTKDFGWYYAGFQYWTVIEALLRAGDEDAAVRDVETLEDAVGQFPRYRIVVARSKATLAKWRDDRAAATGHLETALQEAEALDLPGEQWPVLAALAELADEETAASLRQRACAIVQTIAGGIEDREMREGFLDSPAVRALAPASP